jgi:hypothetical protein
MRKWAKSWKSLLKAEVNIGKILESASKYKHAEERGSTRKSAEVRRSPQKHATFPSFCSQYKSLLHILGGAQWLILVKNTQQLHFALKYVKIFM